MSVMDNLKNAFAGESQASRKYLAFAKKAADEGYPQVAKLFRAASEAETVHAHAHLRAMDGIKSTAENIKAAVAGETYEFEEMYPPFLESARTDGHKKAEHSFKNAMAVEKVHADLYKQALESVEAGKDLEGAAIFVCQVCGHTVMGEAPDECPVCRARRDRFFEVS